MKASPLSMRIREVRDRIGEAAERAGGSDRVTLVAVTKTHPAAIVEAALEAGVVDVGENRVPELEEKVRVVGLDRARWHLIGHLQRNKVERAIPLFHLVHSIDSIRIAEALSAAAGKLDNEVRGLVQVNVSGEGSKGGFSADEAADAVGTIAALPGLHIEGLMTMAPLTGDGAVVRRTFRTARVLWEEVRRQLPHVGEVLSMGMSNDFEIAVEEGSTLVRVGSVLFGERDG